MAIVKNPILRGFNPDPAIVRAGEDYYIATSTFEWFPGVQIHHSKDLIHWELVAHPLNRVSQLNLLGVPDSGGVWAPCLTYCDGLFYLVYTNVISRSGSLKDTHNYVVTCDRVDGDWSEPVFLNSFGFDPSLFHDDDGRKWVVTMETDFRKGVRFAGILLQEYDPAAKKCIGPVTKIFGNTALGKTEGPHLYKINGYYYLMMAEGGTGYGHAVTVARSRNIEGPYEVDPCNPMLTAADKPEQYLQRTGHASMVQTPKGDWYMVHLCGRPLAGRRCVLGRETALQSVVFTEDGWIRMADGTNAAQSQLEIPGDGQQDGLTKTRVTFDAKGLDINFQTLRVPFAEFGTLTERPGYLRLYGRESGRSHHVQAMVARRQQAFAFTAETVVEFEPEYFKEMAGLIYYYNTDNYYFLRFTHDQEVGRCIALLCSDCGELSERPEGYIPANGHNKVWMRLAVDHEVARFYYSLDGQQYQPVGGDLDATILSDEYAQPSAFTGAFVGMTVWDMSGFQKPADFGYFLYEEQE